MLRERQDIGTGDASNGDQPHAGLKRRAQRNWNALDSVVLSVAYSLLEGERTLRKLHCTLMCAELFPRVEVALERSAAAAW